MTDSINTSIDFSTIRKRLDTSNKDSSLDDVEFPLWALLVIYEKANHKLFIEYNRGFKQLIEWLKPIVYIPKNSAKYDLQVLCSYEVSNTGKLTGFSEQDIYECMIEEVIPRLQATNETQI